MCRLQVGQVSTGVQDMLWHGNGMGYIGGCGNTVQGGCEEVIWGTLCEVQGEAAVQGPPGAWHNALSCANGQAGRGPGC